MELQHVNIKIYVDGDMTIDPERFIEVFHEWIAQSSLNELLIDVADYRHVPRGPGVVLIGHDADYSMDSTGSRYGLKYNRKSRLDGTNQDRFSQALRAAANACQMLESELELKFSRQHFELSINDRALAPNTPETYTAVKPELESFLKQVLGHDAVSLQHQSDPRRLFGAEVTVDRPFDLAALLATNE